MIDRRKLAIHFFVWGMLLWVIGMSVLAFVLRQG